MLVLSRKVGESLVIDDNIVITVLRITRSQIRLGIEAPTHMGIRRTEIDVDLKDENSVDRPD